MLCEVCKSVDFDSLLIACLQQCQQRQDAYYGDGDGTLTQPDDSFWFKQHDDIFEVQKWSRDCRLCRLIFQAFEQRQVTDTEVARGLPIVFRPLLNNTMVCYNSEEGLIKICLLDMYMKETHGECSA